MVSVLRIFGSFRLILLLCLVVLVLTALLYGAFGFNLATSPAWQLVPYFLVLFLLSVLPLGLASSSAFSTMGRFQYLLFVLVLLAPVVALAVSWFQGGLYEGLRDGRLFSVLVVSFSLSVLSCAFLMFLKIFAMLVCFFAVFTKRPGIMAVSWMTWFVPGEAIASWSAEAEADSLCLSQLDEREDWELGGYR